MDPITHKRELLGPKREFLPGHRISTPKGKGVIHILFPTKVMVRLDNQAGVRTFHQRVIFKIDDFPKLGQKIRVNFLDKHRQVLQESILVQVISRRGVVLNEAWTVWMEIKYKRGGRKIEDLYQWTPLLTIFPLGAEIDVVLRPSLWSPLSTDVPEHFMEVLPTRRQTK